MTASDIPFEELDIDPYGGDREIPTDPIPLGSDDDDDDAGRLKKQRLSIYHKSAGSSPVDVQEIS